jgi:uncharacterized protein
MHEVHDPGAEPLHGQTGLWYKVHMTSTATPAKITDSGMGSASPSAARSLALPLLRIALVAAASVLTWLTLGLAGQWTAFPPIPLLAAVALLPINVLCLVLVRRGLHRRGLRARDLIGFSGRRLPGDIGWGLLWLAVLYVPFLLTVLGVMWLLHGAELFVAFETVFFDPAAVPDLHPALFGVLAIVTVLTFAPLNAPTEELLYRGYAQGGLAAAWPTSLAVIASALMFGLQHAFYAATPQAVLVYIAAFFVWGVLSGLIYLRQGRLMPLIIAHGLVNLLMTLPALLLAFIPFETIGTR